ncbi:RING finger protein 37 isoform 2-T2 [Pholidichthys leucotaenia]
MVVNLCLPHFGTTVQCNKLCADGYDVTNLVSSDPALRRRGFKLEYFLRPPVQVTLKFDFQVELSRVDVELWPWGMDRGQVCKRLEIRTSSDLLPSTESTQVQEKQQTLMKDQSAQSGQKHQNQDIKSQQSNGHQWSLQAHQWGEETHIKPQQRYHVCQKNPDQEFKLVACCELREKTQVCFTRSNFHPRAPFLSPPPPQPANCWQEEFWSRGPLSLDAVTQLRVIVPAGGAASALGLKALAVWGQPSRYCSTEEVERIKRVHEASGRRLSQPQFSAPSLRQNTQPLQIPPSISIPEEFLDPITQEVMVLPMLLPSGVSVDNSTLQEYQKREATWGRPPNDPFTSVPFTSTSQPLPNPHLKSRIDYFLLQTGVMRKEGTLGRQDQGENPQASRLVASKEMFQNSLCLDRSITQSNTDSINANKTKHTEDNGSDNQTHKSSLQHICKDNNELDQKNKLCHSGISKRSREVSTDETHVLQTKRPRRDAVSAPSCSSHEQRLSASLDKALFSVLQGRPVFTANLHKQEPVFPESESINTTKHCQTSFSSSEKKCSACSCSVSIYAASLTPIYRLLCGHLLCRSCLQKESELLNSDSISTSNHISCRTCQTLTPRSDIIRVHH